MTRETKIGLLVGLAFIIVIGILLSEQLGRSTESPPAPITKVSENVRQSDTVPGGGGVSRSGPASPTNVTPAEPVPTPDEVRRRSEDSGAIVRIGPGPAHGPSSLRGRESAGRDDGVSLGGPSLFRGNSVSRDDDSLGGREPAAHDRTRELTPDRDPGDVDPRRLAAREGGMELEPADRRTVGDWDHTLNGGPSSGRDRTADRPSDRPSAPSGMKTYQAQAGDSLARMANRLLGGDTAANRQAIVKANPSLADNPNLIIAGRTYYIPTGGAGGTGTSPSADRREGEGSRDGSRPAPSGIGARAGTGVGAAPAEHWYTVKAGDSLWGIANHELGTANAIAAIRELNKDQLKGDNVRPGMKLRLPAKSLASAN